MCPYRKLNRNRLCTRTITTSVAPRSARASKMGRLLCLLPTFRGKVALAVALALLYIVATAIHIRGRGSNPAGAQWESLKTQSPEDDLGRNGTLEDSNRILLVSAMFPLRKSKHSTAVYDRWRRHYLGMISTNIYLFTTPAMEDRVCAFRGEILALTIDTTYSSPFEMPPLKGKEAEYRKMHAKDRERSIHSIELYAVWNAKPFFLNAAVRSLERQGVRYDYAFQVVFVRNTGIVNGHHQRRCKRCGMRVAG